MKKKTLQALGSARPPSPHNLAQRLRRLRTDLMLIGADLDDALERIAAAEPPSDQDHA